MGALIPIKPKRLTQEKRENFSLSNELKETLVGLILGDLCIEKISVNARLKFSQGAVHKNYLEHLYNLFEEYCGSEPKFFDMQASKVTGMIYSRVTFNTYSLPCFNKFYDLFYPEGKKIIPQNMGELLTPSGLAYWICDDGCLNKTNGCVLLCTDCFTLAEVTLLANILNAKWNLECTINKNTKYYRIRIPKRSLPKLQLLLKDIMPACMLYKIGL